MQSGSAAAIWPLGACVKRSSGPSSQRNHITRTTAALALSSILAGNFRVKEEPKGINYAGEDVSCGKDSSREEPTFVEPLCPGYSQVSCQPLSLRS